MHYGKVDVYADRVLIIASGPSVEGVDLSGVDPSVYIIAVNSAVEWVPRADAFFTLDPSKRNRELVAKPRNGVRYFMAVPHDYGTPESTQSVFRAPAEPYVTYLKRLTGDGPLQSRERMSEKSDSIHTGNSAYGALGMAYHMNPRKIAILGLDGSPHGHAFEPDFHPGNLEHLPKLFASASLQFSLKRCRVVVGSANSAITRYPRMSPQDAIDWINERL